MLISYDQFDDIKLLVAAIGAENSDPAQLVADAEEELVQTYHFNLQGTFIMSIENQTAIASQLNAMRSDIKTRRIIGHQFFDLLDYVDTNCHNPRLKQYMTSSLAGVFDMHIVSIARNIYFNMFENFKSHNDDTQHGIDTYNNFKAAFTQNLESLDNQNTTFADLIACLGARQLFHDEAAAAHIPSNARPTYTVRDFDELLLDEREVSLPTDDAAKLQQLAAALAAPGEVDAMLKMLMVKETNRIKDMREMGKNTAPMLISIIYEADRAVEEREFYELPQNTQRLLISRAIDKFEVALERLASYRDISTAEYASIITVTKAAQRELKEVIATRWPDTVEERPSVAMTRAQRRQKAEAAAKQE